MAQSAQTLPSFTSPTSADIQKYKGMRRPHPTKDNFRSSMSIFNPSDLSLDSIAPHNSENRTEFRDHTEIIHLSPVKRRMPTDELALGLTPREVSESPRRPTTAREKDTCIDSVGERAQSGSVKGRRHQKNLSLQFADRTGDPNLFKFRYYQAETPQELTQLSVSKALKTIYEHCHETSKILPASARSLSNTADSKGQILFNHVLSDLDAAGHKTYHKTFASPKEGKKRFSTPQKVMNDVTGLSLAEEGPLGPFTGRKIVGQITKGNLGADLVPGLKPIPEEKPSSAVKKQGNLAHGKQKSIGSEIFSARESSLRSSNALSESTEDVGPKLRIQAIKMGKQNESITSARRSETQGSEISGTRSWQGEAKRVLKKGFQSQMNSNYNPSKKLSVSTVSAVAIDCNRSGLVSARNQKGGI